MERGADLVAALLAAEPGERDRLLRAADPGELESALTQLGHTRKSEAAELLALVEAVVEDRALRKLARRELHRLRSSGIEAPQPVATSEQPVEGRGSHKQLDVSEAWASDIDPSGARALWLVAERPLGGIWFAALLLNDSQGLQDVTLLDTTRKRFRQQFEERQRDAATWVGLPGAYVLQLVREAVDLKRDSGGRLPGRYQAFRDVFGEAPGPPERALVYESVSPVEANFNPDWLDESPRLVAEQELAGWYVPIPSELRQRALDVARGSSTTLLVPGHAPEQQALQLIADAAQQALTPAVLRAFRRRLEETAYIFVSTERLPLARVAVAAARLLEDPHLAPERHPLLRLLLSFGLARLLGSEQIGGQRASDALIEIIERATRSEVEEGQLRTRPSGLVLPR